MRMLCYKCDHVWNYKGKNIEGEGYITCPKCYYKIRVDKALIDEPSEQKLLTNLPRERILPKKLLSKLPTTTSFERVYFPNGFDCLIQKDIAAQFKELTLEDLQEEKPVVEFVQEEEVKIKEFDNLSDFNMEILKEKFKSKGQDEPEISIKILSPSLPSKIQEAFNKKAQEQDLLKEKPDFEIRIIPHSPIKLLEHQKSFF